MEKSKIPILTKVILILFGVFLTSLIFAFCLQYFNVAGIWIGAIINMIVVFIGYYYFEKGTWARVITWGVFGTLIIGTILMIVSLQALQNMLKGF